MKDSAAADLLSAIDAVSRGKSFFSPAITRLLAEDYVRALREIGAVDSYARFFNYSLKARPTRKSPPLSTSVPTPSKLIAAIILEKLGLHTPAELILYAVCKGIIH